MNTDTPTPSSCEKKRISSAKWKRENRERHLELCRKRNSRVANDPILWEQKLQRDREHRKKHRAKFRNYDRSRDKTKVAARNIVRCRIYRGTMTRQPCEKCGDPKSQAHHEDYSRPLDVKWLCAKHHKELHNGH